ncbi:glucose-6-phosphate 1-dehydrogenase [Diaminobutyricimonas aerilata]|uniref:Glucose-6-phosphate 1-dehydrogenase n=1 Tax=Diaminobutyricimonas aerilata TaxID=1162967 RepID=A0A2M9CMJ6_9MICO|nr:glucose-6-phosphate dehydrogenase [Diaminobutyricimonas aerilata]PJJ73105.1 glucose-6-phosphate 1-dehydrogenase [Diaminobutyricimonas aerilata]
MTTEPATLIVLGASGDLASRLLLPGLGELLAAEPERQLQLIGAGVEEYDEPAWRDRVRTAFESAGASGEAVDRALESTVYRTTDVTTVDDLRELIALAEHAPALYFALPPAVTVRACEQLREVDLPEGTTLALEKPFGSDAASAADLNRLLLELVPEERIQRVDHFLARATVLNLLGLRFANRTIEPLLSSEHVESIEIVYDEDLALENRARYYDKAGALVDMIQSHLLQVLALLTMEAPGSLSAEEVRDQKAIVLRATRLWRGDPALSSRRGQYGAGRIGDRDLPAYADEPGVHPANATETLAEMTVEVANWRWTGVPILLRSGKAIGTTRKEILITFRPPPRVPDGFSGEVRQDRLRLTFKPDGMAWEINVNGPGDPFTIDPAEIAADFNPGALPAYGEVLSGILAGDPLLSVRGDSAEECWRIVEPVLDAWRRGDVPLETYPAGSAGPDGWSERPIPGVD